jgi:hypothetical protein
MTINNLIHSDFKTVISLINSLKQITPNPPKVYPEPKSLWLDCISGDYIKSLPESVYCIDFETIKDTKVLVMGSAYDLINNKWYVWLSIPDNNDKVSISGKSIIIAHRSTFELGFIWESYDLDCQLRFLDTHVMACQKYHPGNIPLYRSCPNATMFKESNDLSLKELSEKLCGITMDKDIVEVFIKAQDESWRQSKFEINPVFKSSLEKFKTKERIRKKLTKKQEKFQKDLTEEQKLYLAEFKEKTVIKNYYTEEWVKENVPNGCVEILCSKDFHSILTSKKKNEAKWVWRFTPEIEQLFNYNYNDVCSTIAVFWSMWSWYQLLPEDYLGGLYQRSIPLLPLANDWFDKIKEIEDYYISKINLMTELVFKIEDEYENLIQESGGAFASDKELEEFDNFDWSKWTDRTPHKDGKYRWKGETGLSSKVLMRISRLSWKDRPMFCIAIDNEDENGKKIKLKDGSISQKLVWHTCDRIGNWLESVRKKQNVQLIDNPTNTSGEFKDIITVFSKKFIPFWESGDLKAESIYARQIAEIYASVSFWNSFRERITQKLPIVERVNNDQKYLAATLRPLVAGTLTNRAIDPIGLVISKATYGKVGSEIGGHICSPEGWEFVFADFDAIQARVTALYQAVAIGRLEKLYTDSKKLYSCLNNEYSQSVLTGNKVDKSNTAWLIAKQAEWWTEQDEILHNDLQAKIEEFNKDERKNVPLEQLEEFESLEKEFKYYKDKADYAYARGKNANYAMLFGAGADKLGLMVGSYDIAVKIINYFKGVRNKSNWKWERGIASEYFNFSEELANGLYQDGNKFHILDQINSAFLKREMSNVLKPSNRKKEMAGTAQNATVQGIDVDGLCFVTYRLAKKLEKENIPWRYITTVHDALFVMVPKEYTARTSELFQETHEEMYLALFEALNLDPKTAPPGLFQYEGVDICTRWVKKAGDLGKTLSNMGGYDYSVSASLHSSEFRSEDSESFDESCVIYPEEFTKSSQLRKMARLLCSLAND